MGVSSTTKLGTVVFCVCSSLLLFSSATQGLNCYTCYFYQDYAEACQCRLNPSQDQEQCKVNVKFPRPDTRQSKTSHENDSQEPLEKNVTACVLHLSIYTTDGTVEIFRHDTYLDPPVVISKCNLDIKLLATKNHLVCYCDTDWCNGQPFDVPDFMPTTTTTKRPRPCPSTTTTTTTTQKSTTTTSTAGTSTTPCVPNPPTKQTTPQSVTSSSSAFNHPDEYFTMHKYSILCRTTILLVGSLLLHSGVGHF